MGELRGAAAFVIELLEPPRPAGFVSGGYRYQAEIGARLAARSEGRLRTIAPEYLERAVDTLRRERPDTIVVVDGLFAERAALPAGVVALLHTVPRPGWCREPVPAIATAAGTAAAVAGGTRGVEVVRPGLDAFFAPLPARPTNERLRVAAVGTVCAAKGQLLLVRTIAADAELRERVDVVLLGDTAMHAEHVRELELAGAGLHLHLPGVQPPRIVAMELQHADLFVSASRSESFGMAAAEAAACGAPVLAFDAGEISSFVADGANGWLVPATAGDAAFATKMRDVLRSPAALDAARAAVHRPALADWDEVARGFVRACRALAPR